MQCFQGSIRPRTIILRHQSSEERQENSINQSTEHVATGSGILLWCCALPLRVNLWTYMELQRKTLPNWRCQVHIPYTSDIFSWCIWQMGGHLITAYKVNPFPSLTLQSARDLNVPSPSKRSKALFLILLRCVIETGRLCSLRWWHHSVSMPARV